MYKLSRRGFMIRKKPETILEISKLKSELMVKPYQPYNYVKEVEEYPVYQEDEKYLYIPRHYGIKKYGVPEKISKWKNEDSNFKFLSKLRDYQLEIVDIVIPKILNEGGGMLCLPCGYGKTITSLYIASVIKKKTLVIVHKNFLLNQWVERIKEFTDAKVGVIVQDKVEIEGNDIVIGMLQSISKEKYSESLFKKFGFVIFDEAHHAPSKFFSRSLPLIASEFSLSLTATPNRSDKLEKIIYWYMGDILYQVKKKKERDVLVKMYDYKSSHKNFKEYVIHYSGDINLPKTITKLSELIKRNKLIVNIICDILKDDRRHILVLSDRISHLESLKEMLMEKGVSDCDFYIGRMKQKDLDIAQNKKVLLGSYAMACEALDIPSLNTLIMVTSRSNIEQSVGRILRSQDDEIQPLIIDISDKLGCFQGQSRKRINYYRKHNYKIIKYFTEEDKIVGEFDMSKKSIKESEIKVDEIDFID